jgi:hypothetical protein
MTIGGSEGEQVTAGQAPKGLGCVLRSGTMAKGHESFQRRQFGEQRCRARELYLALALHALKCADGSCYPGGHLLGDFLSNGLTDEQQGCAHDGHDQQDRCQEQLRPEAKT